MTAELIAPVATAGRVRHDVFGLARHGSRPALVVGDETVSYADLSGRVRDVAETLGDTRRLVLLEARNDLDTVVGYLAALAGGHVALLVPPAETTDPTRLVDAYDPDVRLRGGEVLERRPGSAHTLHPDLAVLLSTSGTTGSPKLVRLSRGNLTSNASAIAEYLGITEADRAATSLPLHYCYGLSVLNSHLSAGASVVLTELSVVDECFWDLAERTGVTSLAGVPHTFELLEASGLADRALPSLRYVSQAGGRMDPDTVVRWAERGRARGWDLVVMYGQTEATARIAYLPPDLAREHPSAIGCAVPGGCLRLERTPEAREHGEDVGELVYEGPNVMLGYARGPADLARGPELDTLRTGDLARCNAAGLFEVVGRCDRVRKLFGLRVDLDHVERLLAADGVPARCLADDDTLWVFTDRRRRRDRALATVTALGLPRHAIRVAYVDPLPVAANGKTDYRLLLDHARRVRAADPASDPSWDRAADTGGVDATVVRDLYAALLGRPDARVEDSFVDLGGDSLSYVEASVRLGGLLGRLPEGWHLSSAVDLAGVAGHPASASRRGVAVEPSVLLRATAILVIVASHADLISVLGGAHVLLAVAGFNLARFRLGTPGRLARVRGVLGSLLPVVVPTALWVGTVGLVAGTYRPETAVLLNGLLGGDEWTDQWQLWFLEALVWTVVGVAVLLGVGDRWERRRPFAFAVAALAATLVVRYLWVGVEAGATERYTVGVVAWCLVLGWAAAVARSGGQRVLVGVVAVVSVAGFFGDLPREALVAGGVLALLWAPPVRLPRRVALVVAEAGGASLYVYLTHWQVYPPLEDAGHQVLAVVASFAVGIAAWRLARAITPRLTGGRGRVRPATRRG